MRTRTVLFLTGIPKAEDMAGACKYQVIFLNINEFKIKTLLGSSPSCHFLSSEQMIKQTI